MDKVNIEASRPLLTRGLTPCSPNRILIADDEIMIRDLFARVIRNFFPILKIDIATNGFETISKFSEEHHSVIILDVAMPEIDGATAYNSLSAICEERNWRLPHVIFCTGFTPPREIFRIVGSGRFNGLLKKPVKVSGLVDAVQAFLN
jgi:CheY-like chemotaxis protein